MEYTPYTLLSDAGWICILLIVGALVRARIPLVQRLMLPSSMTAGLLGVALGPHGAGLIPFSDQLGTYSSILIAAVFAAIPFNESFGLSLARNARPMWSYAVGAYVLQWGLALLFAFTVLSLFWTVPVGFGLLLPAGWAGGFGTAAAVGDVMGQHGWEAGTSLGFTSATVGVIVCIIGGLIIAKWGAATGRSATMGRFGELPDDMRRGVVSGPEQVPIGRATLSPSSLESLALHVGVIAVVTFAGYQVSELVNRVWPSVVVPVFVAAFVVGVLVKLATGWTRADQYVDSTTIGSISGTATDLLVAFGIASIVPSLVVDYAAPLAALLVFGTVFCVLIFRCLTPRMFGELWLERGLFTWGWSTASIATGIALLRIVDPKGKSKTVEEFSLAYVGFAPIEIAMAVVAPVLVLQGFGWAFIGTCLVVGIGVIAASFLLGWNRTSAVGEPGTAPAPTRTSR